MTFNDNKINLLQIVTIKLRDKIKIRNMVKNEPLLFHVMLKQGITWITWPPAHRKWYKIANKKLYSTIQTKTV